MTSPSRIALVALCALAPTLVACRGLTRSEEITISAEPLAAPAPPPPPVDRAGGAMQPGMGMNERGAPPAKGG